MRRYHRPNRDSNHWTIAQAFERMGALTWDTSMVGAGWPDLMVLYPVIPPKVRLVEIKNRNTAYGRKGLNDQQSRLARWGWPIEVVCDIEDVAVLIKRWTPRRKKNAQGNSGNA